MQFLDTFMCIAFTLNKEIFEKYLWRGTLNEKPIGRAGESKKKK